MVKFRNYFDVISLSDKSGELNLYKLAIPIFFQQIFTMLLSMINTVVMSSVSPEAVAAVSVAGSMVNLFAVLIAMPATGAMILMSVALGMGDSRRCGNVYIVGIRITIAASLVLGIVSLLFANNIISFMKLEENVFDGAVVYFKMRSAFLIFGALTTYTTSILNAYGKTKVTFISGIIGNVVNVILSVLVVNDILNFSNKVLGVAFAGVTGQFFSMVYAVYKFYSDKKTVKRGRFSTVMLSNIMKIGVPGGFSSFSYVAMSVLVTKMIASLGTDMVNTNVFFGTISNFTFQFGAAIAQAGGIMTGRLFGADNVSHVKRLYKYNVRLATFSNCILTLVVFVFSNQLMRIFTDNAEIISAVKTLFLLDIAQEFFRGRRNVTESVLNSMEDTAYTSVVSVITCFAIKLPLCKLVIILGLGLNGFMICGAITECVCAIFLEYRWKRGKMSHNLAELIKKQ